MDGQEPLESASFVEFFEVLPVDVGDESGLEEFLRGGALVVADHHLDGGEAGFACGGEAAAAVDDDVGGVRFEVGFTVRVGFDVGVAVHDRDRLFLAVGLQAAGKVREVSEGGAGVVRIGADAFDGEFRRWGDAFGGHAGRGGDSLAACADGTYSPTESAGTELVGLAHKTSLASARMPTACCDLGA
jgi:hypothetical protein